jgi:gas vesicle protein
MMDNEILQLLGRHFGEMMDKINGVKEELKGQLKTDIRTVTAGQEELKTDINDVKTELKTNIGAIKNDIENSISAVKDDISALETKINAGQEELRQEINVFQERIKNIDAGQAEFEERVTRTVNTRLEDVSSMVDQQTRNLREDLSRNIEASQVEFEERVTRNLREDLGRNIEATRDLETQLAALQVQTRRAGRSIAGTNADKVKPPKFDGSTSWIVFQRV